MKQYMIVKNITIQFECEAKNKKDALKQFAEDFEQLFDNSDCVLGESEPESIYIADENGGYTPEGEVG